MLQIEFKCGDPNVSRKMTQCRPYLNLSLRPFYLDVNNFIL